MSAHQVDCSSTLVQVGLPSHPTKSCHQVDCSSTLANLPHRVATLSPLTMSDRQIDSPNHLAKMTIQVRSPSRLFKFAHQVCPLGQLAKSPPPNHLNDLTL
jgi:hypothetical protein